MLDQIMKLAATNATKQFESLDRITQNVANINTSGFKNVRFEQYMSEYGQLEGVQREDYSNGSIMVTNRPMDVAISGAGFFPVTQPDGTVAYTRDGAFAVNSKGYIVTNRGDMLGSGIQVPDGYQKIMFEKDGTVKVIAANHADPVKVGKIEMVTFTNPEGLKHIGYNKVVESDDSGVPNADKDSLLKQGCLERANVNVFAQVDQVLRLNASVISNLRIVKFSDDIYRQAVNLRQ